MARNKASPPTKFVTDSRPVAKGRVLRVTPQKDLRKEFWGYILA